MKPESKIVTTKDGSSTLFSTLSGDYYHSLHGAETESDYVFIEKGLQFCRNYFSGITILEVGLGTGLNLLLTYEKHISCPIEKLKYVAIEPYPIDAETAGRLEYKALENSNLQHFFDRIHKAEWEVDIEFERSFVIKKTRKKIQAFKTDQLFNLIYYDAFGPAYQSEMWDLNIITKICSMMSESAVLVSYCAQGQFRRNLESCGLKVERLPGPPGKREMIRAIKGLS